jgi:DNA-binding NtrC family response regulator
LEREISILVIDDEQIVLDSVQKQLRDGNFSVHTVSSAPRALEMIKRTVFDIILVDLMMPHTDGLELMRYVKTNSPETPVIMMTGYATVSTALQATQMGAFGYVAKPFTRAELREVVHQAVELVTRAGAATRTAGNDVAHTDDQSKQEPGTPDEST